MTPVQLQVAARVVAEAALVVSLGLVAGAVAAGVAVAHRWYARGGIPEGLAVLAGVSVVAVALNTTAVLGGVIDGVGTIDETKALVNVAAFLAGAAAAVAGARVGDALAVNVFEEDLPEVGRIVRSVGRHITVTLPEEIADMDDHDPVPPEVKAELACRSLSFPRGLTVDELRSRLVTRLKADYGVGYVDLDITEDGEVEYLAVGSRVAGIGPTLAPGSAAVAVRADPAFSASPGDLVQVWDDDPLALVTSAEIRAVAGETVTLALDASDADRLDSSDRYRLVTLPAEARSDREFAALLRAADETLGVVAVAEGSPLAGLAVGAIDASIVAIRGEEGVAALPKRGRRLAPGETVYALARPDVLRRLESAARGEGRPPLAAEAEGADD
ncbi:potassium transporter TrkA [Halomarina halobia]|uniref:Potassium transporter TrkA n=1 Tax=Halomarina halobia TaxID=3033386 RepID=A0ABD6A868_9EURY|nr:hypothetical protein [Halomarina sp. PSR21]